MLPLLLVGVAGVVAAAIKLKGSSANLPYVAAGLRWPVQYVQIASKWAKARGLPLEWVLATIKVESNGNARAAGDSDGRSVGLMQVNSVAHAAELRSAGLTREALFDPETNVKWGTMYMVDFRNRVLAALGGRPAPAPIDVLMRMAYKGPSTIYAALARGENPMKTVSWVPAAAANWRQALAEVTALTRPGKRVA